VIEILAYGLPNAEAALLIEAAAWGPQKGVGQVAVWFRARP
jgi:hypothetical protein